MATESASRDAIVVLARARRTRESSRQPAAVPFDDLLLAATAGGEWALEELYRRHDPAIRRYLRARAGEMDGDDLASQTWIDASRGLSRFRGDEDDFRGWIFTIARRRLLDHGRRRARNREVPVVRDTLEDTSSTEDPAAETVASLDGDAAAREIAEILPPDQAEIVLLRVVGGLTASEVAEVTGRRPGTVRVIQHRALARLARQLER